MLRLRRRITVVAIGGLLLASLNTGLGRGLTSRVQIISGDLAEAVGLSGPAQASTLPAMPNPGIRIPVLGAVGRIVVSHTVNGVFLPPTDPGVVGIWDGSAPLSGSTGEVTLSGHVHWSNWQSPYVFARLATMRVGELVYTTDGSGRRTIWRVTLVELRPKRLGVDPRAFQGGGGTRRLAMISCGGPYDSSTHTYADNVYVYATRAG
jgi:hypothetical protein